MQKPLYPPLSCRVLSALHFRPTISLNSSVIGFLSTPLSFCIVVWGGEHAPCVSVHFWGIAIKFGKISRGVLSGIRSPAFLLQIYSHCMLRACERILYIRSYVYGENISAASPFWGSLRRVSLRNVDALSELRAANDCRPNPRERPAV